MNNEWNLFDTVHRQLAAGQQLVTFRNFSPLADSSASGGQRLAYDENGGVYEIGDEFVEALNACIRELKISWSMERDGEFYQVFRFGPGLNRAAETPEPADPNVKVINILELDPDDPETDKILEDMRRSIMGEDEDEEGDEWKRLLK